MNAPGSLLDEAKKLHEAGQLADAALLYSQIVQGRPDDVEALFGWACVANDRGNFNNAITLLKKVLDLSANHAGAWTRLGTIHIRSGHPIQARQCFEKALASDPASAPAWNNLAITWLESGDPWEAEKICRSGLGQNDRYGSLYAVLGAALHRQGRAAEALESYEKALVLDPKDKAQNLCNIGGVYGDMGDAKKAESSFKKSLKLDPDNITTYYALSRVHHFKPDDALIGKMENLLEKAGDSKEKAARLCFALGKAYDKIGDYDAAFSRYSQGNYLLRSGFRYSTESTKKNFDAIQKVFKKGFEKSALPPRKADFVPIFIVGMPRSGTTLTEQILCCHPKVGAGGEAVYLDQLQTRYKFTSFADYGHDITKFSAESLYAMRDAYQEKLARHAPGKPFITDKMPVNFRYIGLIRLLFPQAKIIHCRRDPMDCCFSIYKCMFNGFFPFSYDLQELGQYYKFYDDLMAFWHKRLPGFIYDVPYEGLVADQERVTREILDFCGLDWNPACLDFHTLDRAVLTASALQVKKPLNRESIGGWRKYEKHLRLLKKELS